MIQSDVYYFLLKIANTAIVPASASKAAITPNPGDFDGPGVGDDPGAMLIVSVETCPGVTTTREYVS